MNCDLAEVRRYWPRAKYVGLRREEKPYHEYVANGCKFRAYLDGRYCVSDCVTRVRVWPPELFRTIPEAMRAAGFGPRPLGKHARERVKRAEYRQYVSGPADLGPVWAAGAASLLAYYQPRLADRQRPCKGARLGKRKREVPDEP